LGAWFNVANAGGAGVTAALAMTLLRNLPYAVGAGILASLVLAPLPLYLAIACPPPDRRRARESIRVFTGDLLSLLRRPSVLWTLLIFLLPAASFAMTNTLGGVGGDFDTPEALVGLLGGAGSAIAAVAGSLLAPRLEARLAPRRLYLLIGMAGAAFTLGLVALPRNAITFGLAMLGENFFQGAAFSVQNLIILRSIGRDNPLASTQFSLLTAALSLPLVYMQVIDGYAYSRFSGVKGSYLADALISGSFCLALGLAVWVFRDKITRADKPGETQVPHEANLRPVPGE
jgi:PAT family beta-lactamase induction signal transducer AmpG